MVLRSMFAVTKLPFTLLSAHPATGIGITIGLLVLRSDWDCSCGTIMGLLPICGMAICCNGCNGCSG